MTDHHYRVTVSYNGSNYFGWQNLGDSVKKATVQGAVLTALRTICKYADCTVAAASRTDAGVHAQGQVAKLTIPLEISPEKLQLGLNSLLPRDIRISQCAICEAAFNPNRHSVSKTYRYYFSTDRVGSPLLQGIVVHIPSKLDGDPDGAELNLESMRQACKLFVGEHDFYSFASRDKTVDSTVRTVSRLDINKADALGLGMEVYYFEICGNGFLKHMVRYIAGAIFQVGRGVSAAEEIRQALANRNDGKLSPRAKARGLHLVEITY